MADWLNGYSKVIINGEEHYILSTFDTRYLKLDDAKLLELSDMNITLPANLDVLVYDLATGKWVNKTMDTAGLATKTGIQTLTNKTLTSPVINCQAAGSVQIPEDTPVNAVASSLTTALAGANNDIVWTAATKGADGDNITIEYVDPGTPSAALSVDVVGNAITVNLATDAGTSSSADIGAGLDGTVTTEVDTPGAAGDVYTIEVVLGTYAETSLVTALVGTDITVTLASDGGTKSSADIGAGANGVVTTEVDTPGVAGDAFSIEVVMGLVAGGAMAAAKLAQAITVTLGMDSGQCATAQIGSGVNGRVDLALTAPGVAGNAWTVTVDGAGADDCDLSAGQVGTDITVQLGKVGAALDPTKNTAALVAAALTALGSLDFTAVASGDGSGVFLAGEGPSNFEGGVDIAADDTKNTAALIAAAIDTLDEVSATASGDGSTAISAIEGPTAFAGGADALPDDTKNTAALIAAAISLHDGVTATASGTGADPISAAEGPTAFVGGVDPAITSTADDVKAAVATDVDAAALVSGADAGGDDGSGTVIAMVATPLAGGVDGTVGLANEIRQDDSWFYLCGTAGNTVSDANWRRITKGAAY